MTSFVQRHQEKITGVLTGFDRLLFRGTLRSISYARGMEAFLCSNHILLKDFARFAQRCTDQLAAHAKDVAAQAGCRYVYVTKAGQRKDDLAREIARRDGVKQGLICVLGCLEPSVSFDVRRNREQKRLELVRRTRSCRFFYFYYLDREFGLMHVRLQSWMPFDIQVCLNGRSYLAQQMDREGIGYTRRENCFTGIANLPRAQELLDQLNRRDWARTLGAFSRRLNPLREGPLQGVFDYYWTIRESEVATDVMFKSAQALAQVYPSLCRHAMSHFSSRDVMRFLGRSSRGHLPEEVTSSMKRRSEGVRIKHTAQENSLKMYDKQGSVLRVEVTINNPRRFQVMRENPAAGPRAVTWQRMRKGISDTARRAQVSAAANARYLEALAVVGEQAPSHRILDPVSAPVRKGAGRYRALRPISPEDTRVFEAALRGEHCLDGFCNGQLQSLLFERPAQSPAELRKRSAWVSRKLRLLRAHRLIRKVGRRRLYRLTATGHQVMTTGLAFRQTDAALLNMAG